MEEWNAITKLKSTKNIALEKIKERSKKNPIIYIFVADYCGHCKEFKKNTYERLVKKIEGKYEYKLCNIENSDYYISILKSANVDKIPRILVFKNGTVKNYSPEEFMETH